MLDKLTPKQEALIPKIREKWIYLALHAGDEIDEKGAKKGILNLYKMAKLKTPVIVLLDSPLAIQYGANQINKGSQVRSQVRSQVGSQVWSQVGSQVRSQVESQEWSEEESGEEALGSAEGERDV